MVDRGGLIGALPATLADITTSTADPPAAGSAIGTLTSAQDVSGTEKTVMTIDCPSTTETLLEVIYRRLQFRNLTARAWPELYQLYTDLTMAAWARFAERKLVTAIGTGSTQVTGGPTTYGAARALLHQVNRAAVAMRDRHRMEEGARLRVILPSWIVPMMQDDVAFEGNGSELAKLSVSEQTIRSWFSDRGVNVTFAREGEDLAGTVNDQNFAAQPGSQAILNYPDQVVWYIFPEGTWVFMDGGELDLGVVRDSTLNKTNAYETFFESFENVRKMFPDSLRVVSTLCASGAAADSVTAVCAGS
jgi:hypothetical protein